METPARGQARLITPAVREFPSVERSLVRAQIGRDPRGSIEIAARCEHGLPAVVRTSPRLEDGSPFPTLYWLTCPMAVRAVSRLESDGRMRELESRLRSEPALAKAYLRAHESYLAERAPQEPADGPALEASAGGMPDRVKCLHALYAHEVARVNPIGAIVRGEIEPLGCPGPCIVEREGAVGRAPGHPGFR